MDVQLDKIQRRYAELERELQDPAVMKDHRRLIELRREHREFANALHIADELAAAKKTENETQALLAATTDHDLRQLAEAEIQTLRQRIASLTAALKTAILPPDPRDKKNVVMEIRAGAGGDEAALFAAELFRAYIRHAEKKGWRTQMVSESRTTIGGYKEIVVELQGEAIYRFLKFESGVHRVQRVPDTEKSGRVHTSTVTVVVLPEADEAEIVIDPKDVEVTATTSSGHGGQSVNTTYSAIRLLHKPTGIIVTCQDERSQMQNREKAFRVLRARLLARQEAVRQHQQSVQRKTLIGRGDRSEKIRTYNFPQDRVTDHRLKQSFHGMAKILDGDFDDIVDALQRTETNVGNEEPA